MKKEREQISWISNARGIACIMVIMLHVSASYVLAAPVESIGFTAGNLLDSFCRACVPIFLMISGFLYIEVTQIRIRHILRVFYALVFYSVPAFLYKQFVSHEPLALTSLIHTPAFFHLWYFYALIPIMAFLYVLQPRLRETLQKDSPHLYNTMALVLAVFFFLSPFTSTLAPGYEPGGVIMDNEFLLIFYFALGALVGRMGPVNLKRKILWLTIFVISSLFIFILTGWEKQQTGHVTGNYYNYENPLVILASLSLFALLRSLDFKFTALNYISRNSLAIYGIHAYVLTLMFKSMGISESHPIPQMLLFFTATLVISLVMAITLKWADRRSYVT